MRPGALLLGGAVAAGLGLGLACSSGQTAYDGLTEPFQIPGGQFIKGEFPPPRAAAGALTVHTVSSSPEFILSGLSSSIEATTTTDAVALGVRLSDLGTGYWVVPASGIPTPATPSQPAFRTFGVPANFNPADAPGTESLTVIAIGSDGTTGAPASYPLCLESRVPDNGHACTQKNPLPAVVIALTWDTNFDVDLNVVLPSHVIVNPKTQLTSVVIDDGGTSEVHTVPFAVGLYDGPVGVIDRDSMGSCVVDGWHEEDLVFQEAPPPGLYDIYANPFASCGQSSVRFTLTIYRPGTDGNLHAFDRPLSGELLASQTTGGALSLTGGAATGLFGLEKQF